MYMDSGHYILLVAQDISSNWETSFLCPPILKIVPLLLTEYVCVCVVEGHG